MSLKKGISACIITKNEESALGRCLRSLTLADEIIVLDSYSSDRTVQIAKTFHARVYKRRFDNFVNQKNACIFYARYNWILVIDADEILTRELSYEILHSVNNPNKYKGFYIPRKTLYLNRWIHHSGWYPNYSIRLFKNNHGKFTGYNVHEKVEIEGKAGVIKYPILHFSYQNITEHVEKINYYSSLIALEKYKMGKRSSVLWAILKSISKFFLTYIWRLGFLDGRVGLIISVLGGYYNFQKYIKLWELRIKK